MEQRAQIDQLAVKYNFVNEHKVEQFSLLTIMNPNVGHHNVAQFERNAGGNQLASQNRADRLKEYHKITADRRKVINEKAKKRKEQLQREIEA